MESDLADPGRNRSGCPNFSMPLVVLCHTSRGTSVRLMEQPMGTTPWLPSSAVATANLRSILPRSLTTLSCSIMLPAPIYGQSYRRGKRGKTLRIYTWWPLDWEAEILCLVSPWGAPAPRPPKITYSGGGSGGREPPKRD